MTILLAFIGMTLPMVGFFLNDFLTERKSVH
jgi:hypothetical protein